METTPRGLRRHIALFGKTNVGKSTLFNLLTGQENSIVSETAGTTTDPVIKSMELIPYGPIVLIDTAGLNDDTYLGSKREGKTREFARRADMGIFIREIGDDDGFDIVNFFNGEKIYVFTKCDLADEQVLVSLKSSYPHAIFVSDNGTGVDDLKQALVTKLTKLEKSEKETLIGDLLPPSSTVVMVVPIDSEAPKGRLILPQVQLIRDCLDNGIKSYVTRETELAEAISELSNIDLVVTDSQAFSLVNSIIPPDIPLTSFSMLLARQKGDFNRFLSGVETIKTLKDGDKILMLEACTHSHNHEDIGRVKIPKALQNASGKELIFDFFSGYDIPKDLQTYSLAILCGSCMINRKEVQSRLKLLGENNVPVTNYGVILAYFSGILDRCAEIFRDDSKRRKL
ncbi:MAG: [FeFe] hydrogenase H-cluster maturation GTPase HydF [Turicibacter sp.]|nr:[FeFe] hydrogenase H-cluster maturation GTPase HydF [Turicibacter sp.]